MHIGQYNQHFTTDAISLKKYHYYYLFTDIECPSLYNDDVIVSDSTTAYHSKVEVSCDNHKVFEDGHSAKAIQCISSGEWNDTYLNCGGESNVCQ